MKKLILLLLISCFSLGLAVAQNPNYGTKIRNNTYIVKGLDTLWLQLDSDRMYFYTTSDTFYFDKNILLNSSVIFQNDFALDSIRVYNDTIFINADTIPKVDVTSVSILTSDTVVINDSLFLNSVDPNYVIKSNTTKSFVNSQIYDDGTYVGINTAIPEAKLHIKSEDALGVYKGLKIDDSNGINVFNVKSNGETYCENSITTNDSIITNHLRSKSGTDINVYSRLVGINGPILYGFQLGNNLIRGVLDGAGFNSRIQNIELLTIINGSDSPKLLIYAADNQTTNVVDIKSYNGVSDYFIINKDGNLGLKCSPLKDLDVNGVSMFRDSVYFDGDIIYNDTYWQELSFPSILTAQGNQFLPDFNYDTLSFEFPADSSEIVYYSGEFNPSMKLNSDMYPHIEWIQDGIDTVNFRMKYRFQQHGEAYNPTWVYINTEVSQYYTYASGSINQIARFPAISTIGVKSGSIIEFVIYRIDDGGTGLVTGDVQVKDVGIHYEIDKPGSDNEIPE